MKMENEAKPDWKGLKVKIKNKFGKLSDSDINGLEGHMNLLSSKVKTAYNYDQGRADKEVKAFNDTLN